MNKRKMKKRKNERLLQKAINAMNKLDPYHRCGLCDKYNDGDGDCEEHYCYCKNFTWHGLKPTEKGSESERKA